MEANQGNDNFQFKRDVFIFISDTYEPIMAFKMLWNKDNNKYDFSEFEEIIKTWGYDKGLNNINIDKNFKITFISNDKCKIEVSYSPKIIISIYD